jgi:hypothetical protein
MSFVWGAAVQGPATTERGGSWDSGGGMKTAPIFSDYIWDRVRLEGSDLSIFESEYSISDTVFVSEYLNRIFMILISNRMVTWLTLFLFESETDKNIKTNMI